MVAPALRSPPCLLESLRDLADRGRRRWPRTGNDPWRSPGNSRAGTAARIPERPASAAVRSGPRSAFGAAALLLALVLLLGSASTLKLMLARVHDEHALEFRSRGILSRLADLASDVRQAEVRWPATDDP